MATGESGNPHLSDGDVDFMVKIGQKWAPFRISREALEDHFGPVGDPPNLVRAFMNNEAAINAKAVEIYNHVTLNGTVINDVGRLLLQTENF